MSDYIKREDAQKVIDRCMNDEIFETDMTHCLEMIPSADVVEVVRCKDCIYAEKKKKWMAFILALI